MLLGERNHITNNKRNLARMDMSCDVTVSSVEKDFTASCNDLSGSGIGFSTGEPVNVGDVLDIDIQPINKLTKPLFATAEVVRVVNNQKSGYKIGAQIRIKN
jgi:hypothetical protein